MIDLTSRAVSLKDFNWKHSPGLLQHRKKHCSSSRRRAGGHAGTKYFLASSFYCGLVNTVARSITLSHVTSIPPLTGLPLHILCLYQEWFPSPFSIFVADGINSGQTMMRVQPFLHHRSVNEKLHLPFPFEKLCEEGELQLTAFFSLKCGVWP